jgi:hypothetical protein
VAAFVDGRKDHEPVEAQLLEDDVSREEQPKRLVGELAAAPPAADQMMMTTTMC